MSNNNNQHPNEDEILRKAEIISRKTIEENLDKGSGILDLYKGLALYGISGESTNLQALSRGHFQGIAAGGLATLIMVQEQLNELGSLPPELVPVMKKTSKGIFWVNEREEALKLGKEYGYEIRQKGHYDKSGKFVVATSEKDKYYYDYPGYIQTSKKISDLAYNIARASASYQGETKQVVGNALSNIKIAASFPMAQTIRPTPEMYGQDEDAD